MSITTDLAGRELAGRYRLVATLGRGSFAVVYLAEDLRLSRRVAVKLLHPGLATDETFARRFRTEAELLAGLNHPHVLSVFDWGEEGDDAFLVTEYLAGGSLAQLLRSGVRLGVPEATALGAKVAHGLAHAHRHGLVHRDIKPANLLFDEAGEVRVADFGIARAIAEAATTTPEGTLVGTARYASPEQAEARSLDGRSDVYSLALVLYEAVVGSVPFVGETDAATLLRRVGAKLPPSRELGALYPVLVQAAISDPLARLDAAECALELELLARTLPTPSPLPIPPPKVEFAERPATKSVAAAATEEEGDLTAVGDLVGAPPPPDPDAAAEAATRTVRQVTPATTGRIGATGGRAGVGDGVFFDQGADAGGIEDAPTVIEPPGAPRARRARRGRRILVVVAVLIVLLAGSGVAVLRLVVYGHHVPTLSGLSASAARQAVNRAGLVLKVGGTRYSATVPVGEILTQSPAAGTARRSGATVTVTLSLGVKPVAVPSVVGQGRKAAVRALVAANLKPAVTTANSETVPRGRVISQTPNSGTEPPGTAVALQVSLGPAPRTIPQFPNASYASAAASLQALRLVPSEQQAYSSTVASGEVISTTPAEGATGVKVGSTVVVTVSKGPQMVVIPPVAGASVTAAVAALRADGLVVAEVIGPPFATTSVTTNPAPGTSVQVGSSVTLYAATS